jgi:hypothetical protein
MQYTGTVKFIWPKETIGVNDLEKQTIVLEEETDREFKGGLAVDFFKEKTELVNNVKIGDLITVHINTRVNESKTQPGRYFNSITGWRLESGAGNGNENKANNKKEDNDDLPF